MVGSYKYNDWWKQPLIVLFVFQIEYSDRAPAPVVLAPAAPRPALLPDEGIDVDIDAI